MVYIRRNRCPNDNAVCCGLFKNYKFYLKNIISLGLCIVGLLPTRKSWRLLLWKMVFMHFATVYSCLPLRIELNYLARLIQIV